MGDTGTWPSSCRNQRRKRSPMGRTKTLLVQWFDRWLASRSARMVTGLGLVLHGLGHAVFPLRGAGSQANGATARMLIELAWIAAMTGFVAGGMGLAGARPFHRVWRFCVAVAAAGSVIAFAAVRRLDLTAGLAFDVLALAAFYRWAPLTKTTVPIAIAASPRWKRVLSIGANVTAVAFTAYIVVSASLRSWHSRWGVTDDELDLVFPGDAVDRD